MFLPPEICKKKNTSIRSDCSAEDLPKSLANLCILEGFPHGDKKTFVPHPFLVVQCFFDDFVVWVNGISSLQHRSFHGQVSCCALVIHQNPTSQDTTSSWPDRKKTFYEDIWSNMVFVASLGTDVVWSSDQTDRSLGTNCKKRIPPKMTYV